MRNWSSGAKFAGLLVMTLNSDGPVGCLGVAKALQIGGSPRSGCTQALANRLCDFLLGVSHRRRQMWYLDFSESLDRRSIHQLSAILQNKKKEAVVVRRPSDGKFSIFSSRLRAWSNSILI